MKNGQFVISLDFEIYWGVKDVVKLSDYKTNLLGVRKVIPGLLKTFENYKVQATFASVGFLFFDNKKELIENLPSRKPQYVNSKLSPYLDNFQSVGENEETDPFHFGNHLIQTIKQAGQEIGSHSFSHYYCLEKGQTKEDFYEDIKAAKNIALRRNVVMTSFIFPRNQYNEEYIRICKEMGFTCFRGNEKSTLFSSKSHGYSTLFRRPFRLIDSYFNLSGHNCYKLSEVNQNEMINIPSSRFLRPYSHQLKLLENLKLKRITNSMTYAAKHNLCYHLWWHPHNFGNNMADNFFQLDKILIHYQQLNKEYGFQSMNMKQLTNIITDKHL